MAAVNHSGRWSLGAVVYDLPEGCCGVHEHGEETVLIDTTPRPRGPRRKPVRVFISHTSELSELPAGRSFVAAAKHAVNDASDVPVEMGSFGPSSSPPAAYCVDRVAQSDVYVGIIGLRYGSPVADRPDVSYCELEYETAAQLGMDRLIFLLEERSEDVPGPIGPPKLDERQRAFRARLLLDDVMVATVTKPEELSRWLLRALYELPDQAAIPNELSRQAVTDARRDLLGQVRKLVVDQESSRHLPIAPGLAERPAAEHRPLERRIRHRRAGPDRPLPRDQSIDELFRESRGQLLILGEPGAGKSSLLLELAGRLAEDAERSRSGRLPVVLHLATWVDGRRPFDRWLVDELRTEYGLSVSLSRHWIGQGLLVLLLDGLDEVDPSRRDACVEAINAFRREHPHLSMAVCSRTPEFESLRVRLELRSAVVVLPLERLEVGGYLQAAGPSLAGLHTALGQDDALWELVTTPLFLDVVVEAYRDRSPQKMDASASLDQLRAAALSAYVERTLEALETEPDAGHHRREDLLSRLRWLAGVMDMRTQSVLHIDLVQPDWLPTLAQRSAVSVGVPVALGLLVGLFTAVVLTLDGGSQLAVGAKLAYVLVTAAVVGLSTTVVAYRPGIELTVELGWSWRKLRNSFPSLLRSSIAAAAVLGPVLSLAAAFATLLGLGHDMEPIWRLSPIAEGLLVLTDVVGTCLGVGLIVALTAGINERFTVDPPGPGRAVRSTGRSWWVSTVMLGLPSAILFLLAAQGLVATVIAFGDQPIHAGDRVLPSLAWGVLIGVAVGTLARLTFPTGQPTRLRRGLILGLASAAVLGPSQVVALRALDVLGVPVPLGFNVLPGVPVWLLASTLIALIVTFGGSPRMGLVAGLVIATAAGTVRLEEAVVSLSVQPAALSVQPAAILIVFAVGSSFVIGLRQGGSAFLRHWVLRWWLARDGLLPLDAVPFLELSTRLGLLRRRGGGFQFLHRLLQEHLAMRPGPADKP